MSGIDGTQQVGAFHADLFAAELFGVTDIDPMTCLWAVGLIVAAALVASLAPAWRATRVDPIVALRQE